MAEETSKRPRRGARRPRKETPPDEALKEVDDALRGNPDDPNLWFRRGVLLFDFERWPEALEALAKAESHDATIPHLYLALSLAYSKLGRTEEAAEAQRKALRAPPAEVPPPPGVVAPSAEPSPTATAGPAEDDFDIRLAQWEQGGYDVARLREILERDPDRARTAFFQFQENVKKVEVLREALRGVDPTGLEADLARLRELFRSPHSIWRVEAEMATLLDKAEARDRAQRARTTPSPRMPAAAPAAMPGATNGRPTVLPTGRVNGLVNGVRHARAGLTNGLTNGLGFTNGLGGRRFGTETRGSKSRILLVPLVAILLLSVSFFFPPEPELPIGGIVIDDGFEDWRGVPAYTQAPTGTNPAVDLVEYKTVARDGRLSLYATVAGTIFGTMDGVDVLAAFVDADGDRSTGYDEGRLGADALIEVWGGNGTVMGVRAAEWSGNDRDNWTAWQGAPLSPSAAAAGSELELQIDLTGIPTFDPSQASVSLHFDDQQGGRSSSALLVGPTFGALEVRQAAAASELTASLADLLILTFRAIGSSVNVSGVTIDRGPQTPPLDSVSPFALAEGESRQVRLTVETTGLASGTMLTAWVASVDADRPATIVGPPARAYVTARPAGKVVDGLFDEWSDVRPDATPVADPNVDLIAHAAEVQGTSAFLFVEVRGTMLGGQPAPSTRLRAREGQGSAPSAPSVPERRVGEDVLVVYFDSPAIPSGTRIDGVVADVLVDVRGRNGEVRSIEISVWDNGWTTQGTATAIAAGTRLEGSLDVPGLDLGGAPYVIDVHNWRGLGDRSDVEGVRGVRSSSENVSLFGSYQADLPLAADGWVRFGLPDAPFGVRWRLPDVKVLRGAEEILLASPGPTGLESDGFVARYRPYADAAIEVRYEAEATHIKEHFVLSALPAIGSADALLLDMPLEGEGGLMLDLRGVETDRGFLLDGDVVGTDGRGRSLALLAPWAEDAAGRRIDLRFRWADGRLGILVPGTWLEGATVPIVIDPTTTIQLKNDGTGSQADERFGWSLAMGDFNGDSKADILVGAPVNDETANDAGNAYIFFGPLAADDATPDVRIRGGLAEAELGYSVAAGKFNGDQYWDALVARRASSGTSVFGNVSLYYGSASWSSAIDTANVTFVAPSNPKNFGWAVAAGNLDNANDDDVLIAEPGRDNDGGSASSDGAVHVYASPFIATESTADFTLYPSTNVSGQFGQGGIAVGKIDSDAFADVVVGEPAASSNNGRVHFFKGSTFSSGSGGRAPNAVLSNVATAEQFGGAVAVGRINADTYADVVVGAPAKSSNAGGAYIFLANSDGTGITGGASPTTTLANQSSTEQFGTSVLVVDFDDDGTGGVFVGAPFAAAGGTERGRAYWFDDPTTDQTVDETISGSQDVEHLGQSLAAAKFASDTRTRVAIGAYQWDDTGQVDAGRVIVAEVPEPGIALAAVALVLILFVRSLERRRLVRKR